MLNGENNSSYPVELFTKDRELFRQNSRDVFVVRLVVIYSFLFHVSLCIIYEVFFNNPANFQDDISTTFYRCWYTATCDSKKVVLQKHKTLNSGRTRDDGYLHKTESLMGQ